ncbi:predicted protein [Aspergillus terreus NIH2624]|uniref:Uncharacterized protein n=1 Tax=Aspergillus terreus (strain NIH 2624 / FGSC A1156) TaxID=341663 RepID=Q0CN72_ASPTN|nr:uncharacterized protein ATEG_04862 [Aspergillus terreus NIH2624]EAU35309.1 predicted protein [Aspergillus terreus NIH2624]
MPMKWTPENDQLLLLKILETHDLSVDTKRVAEAWPKGDNKPTPRAITERLVRMRQIVKASSNGSDGHFSIGKGTANSAASTPRKPRSTSTPKGGAGPKTPASSGKRKRRNPYDDGDGDSDDDRVAVKMEADDLDLDATPSRKRPLQPAFAGLNLAQGVRVGTTLKLEPRDEEGVFGVEESPSKRVRKASVLPPGMVSYDVDEDEGETSASEYQPEVGQGEQEADFMMAA